MNRNEVLDFAISQVVVVVAVVVVDVVVVVVVVVVVGVVDIVVAVVVVVVVVDVQLRRLISYESALGKSDVGKSQRMERSLNRSIPKIWQMTKQIDIWIALTKRSVRIREQAYTSDLAYHRHNLLGITCQVAQYTRNQS